MACFGHSPRDSQHHQLHHDACGPSYRNDPSAAHLSSRQGSRQHQRHQDHQHQQQHVASVGAWPAAAGRPGSRQSRPASVLQHAARPQNAGRAPTTAVPCRTDSLKGHTAAGPSSALPQAVRTHAAAPSPAAAAPAHAAADICGTFSTPRDYNRGPRSYALALAEASRTSTPQHSQADRAQHSSRPSSAALRPGARPPGPSSFSSGFQASSNGSYSRSNSSRGKGAGSSCTPRRPDTTCQQGVLNHNYHQQQQHQQHLRLLAGGGAAAAGVGVVRTPSSRQQGCGLESSSLRRPGSATTTSGSQHSPCWPCEQLASCRPHTVAAGSPLLLSDCFRPSRAAGPASISGVEGHQCISRPHTAAAAVAGWWDAASAGLSSRLDEGGGSGAEAEAELQRQRQLQQLWCAVHEIDGRPATRNGVRSRPASACVANQA